MSLDIFPFNGVREIGDLEYKKTENNEKKKKKLSPGLRCGWFSFNDQNNLRKNGNDVVMLESLWSSSGSA